MIVLTGSSGGIGSAIARRLPAEYSVLGIDRVRSAAWRGDFLLLDLSSEQAVNSACEEILRRSDSASALIFAAGAYHRCPIDKYDTDMLNQVMWDNFTSIFLMLKILLPHMARARTGRVILVSSQAAITGGLDAGYAASKAAALALIKSVAREFGPLGIRSNAVSPGPVTTPMSDVMGEERKSYYTRAIPIGRLGTPEEIAEVVCFLATAPIDGINGATIDVDGGLVRR